MPSNKDVIKAFAPELSRIIPLKRLSDRSKKTVRNKLIAEVADIPAADFDFIKYIKVLVNSVVTTEGKKELREDEKNLQKLKKEKSPNYDPLIEYRIFLAYYSSIVEYYVEFRIELICYEINDFAPDSLLLDSLILEDLLDPSHDKSAKVTGDPKPKKKKAVKKNKYEIKSLKDIDNLKKFLRTNIIGQDEAIDTACNAIKLKAAGFSNHVNLMFIGKTGRGKCFGKDTKIKMFDGSWKYVQNVEEGDLLMGDDSTPRKVSGLASGKDELYKITPIKGDPYVVNQEHILCLRHTSTGEIVEITVRDYLEKHKTFKKLHKQYRVSVDQYQNSKEYHELDPYYLGLWLGDGHKDSTAICNIDEEVFNYLENFAEDYDMNLSTYQSNGKAPSFALTTPKGQSNWVLDELKRLNLHRSSEKFIPEEYLRGSKETRLSLLAGLIDSDGSYHYNCFDFVTKYETLANQVQELCRSLGLWAQYKQCNKSSQNGTEGTYYRLCISGDTHLVPCLIARKKCHKRKQLKDVTNTGIVVESIGVGDYYGFVVDGNHRFLLEDFTVTHNTQLARKLGEKFSENFWLVNCGEFTHGHEVGRLLGSPPGYIGHSETSMMKEKSDKSNKWTIVFDEIEKAHEKFYNFLLALMDTGKCTDNSGNEIDFSESIIILTSNCGLKDLKTDTLNFVNNITEEGNKEQLLKSLEKQFSPEFRGRIDETVFFNDLNTDDVKQIVELNLKKYPVKVTPQLVDYIVSRGYTEEFGARDVERAIKTFLALPLADELLSSRFPEDGTDQYSVDIVNDELQVINSTSKG